MRKKSLLQYEDYALYREDKTRRLMKPKFFIASLPLEGKETYTYYFRFKQVYEVAEGSNLAIHMRESMQGMINNNKMEAGVEKLLKAKRIFNPTIIKPVKDAADGKVQLLELVFNSNNAFHYMVWRNSRKSMKSPHPIYVVEIKGHTYQVLPDKITFAKVFKKTLLELDECLIYNKDDFFKKVDKLELVNDEWVSTLR